MELVTLNQNGQAVTTSKIVAEAFGMSHDRCMEVIRNIIKESGGGANPPVDRWFGEITVTIQNEKQPGYIMGHRGFSLLSMGFNGPVALQAKVRFIEAFEEAKQRIEAQNSEQVKELRREIEQIKAMTGLIPETSQEQTEFTVVGYARKLGFQFSPQAAAMYGKRATKLSQKKGVPIKRAMHAIYGYVNLYHIDILKEVLSKPLF